MGERARLEAEINAHRELRAEADGVPSGKVQVVEIPFGEREPKPAERLCSQRYADGRQCQSPAADGKEECSRHRRWNYIYPTALPFPEDALSLQEMMGYIVVCVVDKLITADQAHAISELCRIMEKNLWRCERDLEATVRPRLLDRARPAKRA